MASDITLSAGVRQNLLSLQKTADMMASTQNKLATGKRVNSALDNPSNYFTASALHARSNDLNSLMDSMSNGIKTLEAADNGLKAITKTVESMQSTLRQARQDKSFQTKSYGIDADTVGITAAKTMSFKGGAVGDSEVKIDLQKELAPTAAGGTFTALDVADGDEEYEFTVQGKDDASAVTVTLTAATDTGGDDSISLDEAITAINTQLTAGSSTVQARKNADGDGIEFFDSEEANVGLTATIDVSTVTASGTTASAAGNLGWTAALEEGDQLEVKTVDDLVSEINENTALSGKIRASNDNGQLRIENQSTQELTVTGVGTTGKVDGATGTSKIEGNKVRADLAEQFNELRDQLDKLSDDASFNGINLLRGDKLTITFNESSTSTIDIQSKDGKSVNAATLGIIDIEAEDLDSDDGIDALLNTARDALNTIRSQSSTFGSNLSVVENRSDFTKNMMNTLQTGGDALVLADTNEEAANLLALQTRQQLSSTALSMASQADQAALRLF